MQAIGSTTPTLTQAPVVIEDDFPAELASLNSSELDTRSRLLENDLRVMKSEIIRLQHEQASMAEQLADNVEKIKLNKQLPYLVANVVELLEVEDEEEGEDFDEEEEEQEASAKQDKKMKTKKMNKCAVVKTTTRTVNDKRERE